MSLLYCRLEGWKAFQSCLWIILHVKLTEKNLISTRAIFCVGYFYFLNKLFRYVYRVVYVMTKWSMLWLKAPTCMASILEKLTCSFRPRPYTPAFQNYLGTCNLYFVSLKQDQRNLWSLPRSRFSVHLDPFRFIKIHLDSFGSI